MPSPSKPLAGRARRRASIAFLALALLGAALAIVGATWKSVTTSATFWTAEQAAEFAAASDAVNHPAHAEGATPQEQEAVHAAAKQRFDAINRQLEQARYARDGVGPLLVRTGLAAAVAFGIGYLATRGE